MNWTPLYELAERDFHSPATVKRCKALNTRIAEVMKTRQVIDGYSEKLRAVPIGEADGNAVFQADCPAQNRFDLLQREFALRHDLHQFYEVEAVDRKAAREASLTNLRDVEAEIKRKLIEVGYLDPDVHGMGSGCIIPGFITRHPEVIAARQLVDSLDRDEPQPMADNAERAELVQRELEQLRDRALRGG
ncbi:MAG: hypothetical protein ACK5Q5_23995 [Planctomycetaceae bacterium]